MKVLKFGGTSVGSPESIQQVVQIINNYVAQGHALAVVSSAMGGVTNQLIEMGEKAAANDESYHDILREIEKRHFDAVKALIKIKDQSSLIAGLKKTLNELEDLAHGIFLLKELSPRTLDLVLSFGERLSCYLIAGYARKQEINAEYLDARTLIKTDNRFGKARVKKERTDEAIRNYFEKNDSVPIITGFISSTDKGETTTLGRGGSDYTAAIFGAALGASEIEIWTDVDGVMTTDPRKVARAFSLSEMTYEEAMEMSHFGAKVIYPPTLQPAFYEKIPLRIKNTFNPAFVGTKIFDAANSGEFLIKGISSIPEIALVNLQGSGMVGVPGVSSRLFGALATHGINIILITQASSEHSICFALDPEQIKRAITVIENEFRIEIENGKIENVSADTDLAILAIIGENMRKTPGIAAKMFNALGKNGINISAIAQGSSERNLSIVIHQHDLAKGLNTIHEAFFLSDVKNLNVFLIGTGLIGSTLLSQFSEHNNLLIKDQLLKINVIGLANNEKMVFSTDGIELESWESILVDQGKVTNIDSFTEEMIELNLPNSVFVDCTASKEVVTHYHQILNNSISIATPNKIATSGDFENYLSLKETSQKFGIKFLFETNVGAGLPVISTLNDLKASGDKIIRVEGVLSGTLSYIFNHFSGEKKFSEVVKGAMELGYTEPDPREDLKGMDVARKILILGREVGFPINLDDVVVENILPETCLKAATVEDFLKELESSDHHFDRLREKAAENGGVLRFIAKMEDGVATVQLETVDQDSPFYGLSGSDNMITYVTERYKERPLVIKGPGAGAQVTAAGVFAELIRLSHFLG